ncbi:Reticulon-4-interacting protein 1, mitochondrial [Liparis tanakae]|uniref:Reticulon-4-interacting protein 1, mitochondrial n=1 Tax=Liparis tanakae TaxID=230148 RepID=A0A4Z2G894_9TELE|nr:Reticulon-4-interacting protein 1, mitochondrial [Liparis tanakae]
MGSVRAMASARLRCLFNAKAADSTNTLARAYWSVCPRRHICSSPSRLHGCMSAWVIDQYGTNGSLKYTEELPVPTVSSPSEVMIRVHAASLNPLDIAMRGGYGAKILKFRRDPLSVMHHDDSEFPLILGRDVSGVVEDCGSEVWATVPPWKQGSLAEFVTLTEYELLKAWGAHVTVTCSANAEGLVRGLGADEVVDYTARDSLEQLEMMEKYVLMPFDVILDNVGGETEQWAMGLLKPWSGAKYVTLVTPLLLNTDSLGLMDGILQAGCALHSKVTQNVISRGVFYRWGFYAPDGPALDEVSKLVDAGMVLYCLITDITHATCHSEPPMLTERGHVNPLIPTPITA